MTTIKSTYGRPLTLKSRGQGEVLLHHGLDSNNNPWPTGASAIFKISDILAALPGVGGTYTVADLPTVRDDGEFLKAGDTYRKLGYYNAETLLKSATELLAIGLELQKREAAAIAEKEAAKAAEEEVAKAKAEAELNQLRTDVIHEHKDAFGYTFIPPYGSLCPSEKRMIDALVELIQADRKRQAEVQVPF